VDADAFTVSGRPGRRRQAASRARRRAYEAPDTFCKRILAGRPCLYAVFTRSAPSRIAPLRAPLLSSGHDLPREAIMLDLFLLLAGSATILLMDGYAALCARLGSRTR